MKALPFPDKTIGDEKQVTGKFSLLSKKFEPAGEIFEKLLGIQSGRITQETAKEEEITKEEKIEEKKIDFDNLKNKKRKQSWVDKDGLNYYEVLELPSRNLVTEEIVKKQYKKLCIKYHPDKYQKDEYDEKAKKKWLSVG